jgi:hypothetical protein
MVGADRQDRNSQRQRHHAPVPPQESSPYRAAGAWRVVVTTSRHVPHSATPLAWRRTVRAVIDREGRTASGSALRCASTWSAIVRAEMAARFSERAASLELIQQQQVIVAGQRGVIMRGRRGSRYGPPARRRTRTSSVGRRASPTACRWTRRRGAAGDRPAAGTSGRS